MSGQLKFQLIIKENHMNKLIESKSKSIKSDFRLPGHLHKIASIAQLFQTCFNDDAFGLEYYIILDNAI